MDNPIFKEKRQFGRIKIPDSILCELRLPQSEEIVVYRSQIKNISIGGIYFVCDEKPPLDRNDVRDLIFDVIYRYQKIYQLRFHALVVRTENIGDRFAVALKFLSDPIYYPLKEVKDRELPFLDKIRIMYQNYELYKKAYELIKQTPDIRTDKIKRLFDQKLYQIVPIKLAQSIKENLKRSPNSNDKDLTRKLLPSDCMDCMAIVIKRR
jgi:hypothetical protein